MKSLEACEFRQCQREAQSALSTKQLVKEPVHSHHLEKCCSFLTASCFNSMPAMPCLSGSRFASHGETTDLTATVSASSSVPPSENPPQLIDLTMPDQVSCPPRDHMHAVVALLRPSANNLTQDRSEDRQTSRVTGYTSSSRRDTQTSLSQSSDIEPDQAYDRIYSGSRQRYHERAEKPSMSSIPLAWNPDCRSDSPVGVKYRTQKFEKEIYTPFPFMDFPPEIRNCVYRMLLTTPKTPIEFPEPTGRNRALRAANWEKCTSWKMRRRHKTLFLEVLEVSKQLHAEASGILYGCNVFKYRSDYGMYTR